MRKVILLLIGAALAGCRPEFHRAQIDVEGGASVVLIIRPMFSLQSDWQRKLLVEAPTGSLETGLFEDTGWWRGSNLYRHSSGIYVLHEGQAGCILFRVSPPELVRDSSISCDKTVQTANDDTVQAGNSLRGFPASKFYTDFQFIGTFMETPKGKELITFFGADEQSEAELPNEL
jgi:hypothetical protein